MLHMVYCVFSNRRCPQFTAFHLKSLINRSCQSFHWKWASNSAVRILQLTWNVRSMSSWKKAFVWLATIHGGNYKSNLVWKPVPCVACNLQIATKLDCEGQMTRTRNLNTFLSFFIIASFDLLYSLGKPGRPPIKCDDDFTKFRQQDFPTGPLDECNETLMWCDSQHIFLFP